MADSTASLTTSTPADLRAASYQASRRLVTSARLRDFSAPRDVALVEASGNSGWAHLAFITSMSNVALSLGGALQALEVNPLWVNGDQVEALDALVITEPEGSSGTEQAKWH